MGKLLNRHYFWAAIGYEDRMFELTNITAIHTAKNMIGLDEANRDEFLHQSFPFADSALFVCIREGFRQHWKGPALSERQGIVTLLQISRQLCPQRL